MMDMIMPRYSRAGRPKQSSASRINQSAYIRLCGGSQLKLTFVLNGQLFDVLDLRHGRSFPRNGPSVFRKAERSRMIGYDDPMLEKRHEAVRSVRKSRDHHGFEPRHRPSHRRGV